MFFKSLCLFFSGVHPVVFIWAVVLDFRVCGVGGVLKLKSVFDSYIGIYYSIHNIIVSMIIHLNAC